MCVWAPCLALLLLLLPRVHMNQISVQGKIIAPDVAVATTMTAIESFFNAEREYKRRAALSVCVIQNDAIRTAFFYTDGRNERATLRVLARDRWIEHFFPRNRFLSLYSPCSIQPSMWPSSHRTSQSQYTHRFVNWIDSHSAVRCTDGWCYVVRTTERQCDTKQPLMRTSSEHTSSRTKFFKSKMYIQTNAEWLAGRCVRLSEAQRLVRHRCKQSTEYIINVVCRCRRRRRRTTN